MVIKPPLTTAIVNINPQDHARFSKLGAKLNVFKFDKQILCLQFLEEIVMKCFIPSGLKCV